MTHGDLVPRNILVRDGQIVHYGPGHGWVLILAVHTNQPKFDASTPKVGQRGPNNVNSFYKARENGY